MLRDELRVKTSGSFRNFFIGVKEFGTDSIWVARHEMSGEGDKRVIPSDEALCGSEHWNRQYPARSAR